MALSPIFGADNLPPPPDPTKPLPASALASADEVFGQVSTLRPLYLIRNRLEERGLWPMFASILAGMPDKLLTILSTTTPNFVDITDPDVIALIRAAGGNPAEILV